MIRIMEKRDAMFLLLVLGGGGYATYANWDTIVERLGLEQLDPGRIKAIVLAKDASDFQGGATNWQYIQSRHARGEIAVTQDPWVAKLVTGQQYRVTVHWNEDDADVVHGFTVNIATRTVIHQGTQQEPASPR